MHKAKLYFLLLISFLFPSNFLFAQSISGVINSYAKVHSISGNQFTIGTPGGKSGASLADFDPGRRVMVYQAKGLQVNESNNGAYGLPTNYHNSGRYELATILSRTGNVVTLTTPQNNYDVSGLVQLVSMPQYNEVTATGTVYAAAWDKNNGYGGIIALEANCLILSANISADGAGFKGGASSSNNGDGCATVYISNDSKYGGKGEGNTTSTSYTRGMSALGSGGGGGSTHNGGGAGGSNHGYGDDGGHGWSCSGSNVAGGKMGQAYAYNPSTQRLFFGGGGGGGQKNNSYNTAGGNGGGIVFLKLHTLKGGNGTRTISARGAAPPGYVSNDGAGGGGAGGIVYIATQNYDVSAAQIILNADGGDGGDVNTSTTHGGGGGGGSGIVISSVQRPFGVYYSADNGDAGQDSYSGASSGTTGYDPTVFYDFIVQSDQFIPDTKGPGGIISGLGVWLKAEEEYLFTGSKLNGSVSDGSGIQSWTNIANTNNYITTTGGSTSATFQDDVNSLLNSHPVVRMSNTNRKLRSRYTLEGQSIFVVAKPGNMAHLDGVAGFEGDKGIRSNSSATSWYGNGNSDEWFSGGSAFINGQSTYTHNKKWHIAFQKRGSSHTNYFFTGGYRNNREYTGDIAEMIVYNDAISSSEQQKIETYLAIKYGISLYNKDYVASNGDVIWDYSANTSFHNDVTGIGRDDISGLNQTKSKSTNSDGLLTIQSMSNFDNRRFVVWGNDNGSISQKSTNVPSNYQERITRVWKVNLTGTTPALTIKVPVAPLGITSPPNETDLTLIASDDNDFSDITYYSPGSLNASRDTVTFSNVYLSNNEKFTITTQAVSVPGSKASAVEFYLTAGNGTGTTTEGAQVSSWDDQINSHDASLKSGISGPLYRANGMNFNPSLDFTTSNRAMTVADASGINTANTTISREVTIGFKTGSDVNSRQVIYEQGGTTRGFNIYIADGMVYMGAWNDANDGSGSPWTFKGAGAAIEANRAYVVTFYFGGTGSISGVIRLYLDGLLRATIENIGTLYSHASDVGIGAMIQESYFESPVNDESGDGYYFKGELGELIYFRAGVGTNTRGMAQSAMAIKYGISLNQTPAVDYYSSEYDVIWDGSENTTYNNDIAAIGRDDNSLINQIKSKSTNSSAILTVANGGNFSSPSAISTDLNFMFWAHNGSSSTSITGDYYNMTDNGSARIWKITEVGTIGSVKLRIPKSSIASDATMMFVSTDPTFPNSGVTDIASLVSVGDEWEITYNFSNGQYFSFGRDNSAPVLSNLESETINHCDNSSTLSSAISILDEDNDQVTATISIGTGYVAAEDSLVYTSVAGVTTTSHTKQQIQLSAATTANMQTALRAVQYYNKDAGTDRTTGNRTINFIINDGWVDSNQLNRTVQVFQNPTPTGIYHDN